MVQRLAPLLAELLPATFGARPSELEQAAPGLARELPTDRFRWPDFLESASESANARVVVFSYTGPPPAVSASWPMWGSPSTTGTG